MCEKKIRKITKGPYLTRLREARRVQHIQNMTPTPVARGDNSPPRLHQMVPIDKAVQNKVILELAWKTIALMHKNRIIQQKIIALQKETSEFVATIMSNPESRMRYMSQMRAQANAAAIAQDMTIENKENNNIIFKTEPEDAPMSFN